MMLVDADAVDALVGGVNKLVERLQFAIAYPASQRESASSAYGGSTHTE